jgi:hypothetical protein
MNPEDHLVAARELIATRTRLLIPDDIRTYVEVTLGAAQHYVAYGLARRHGTHPDHHEGMARVLRERGHPEIADALVTIEHLRLGRWYGRRGNGRAAIQCDQLLGSIEAWAVE